MGVKSEILHMFHDRFWPLYCKVQLDFPCLPIIGGLFDLGMAWGTFDWGWGRWCLNLRLLLPVKGCWLPLGYTLNAVQMIEITLDIVLSWKLKALYGLKIQQQFISWV